MKSLTRRTALQIAAALGVSQGFQFAVTPEQAAAMLAEPATMDPVRASGSITTSPTR